jgi:hypothetical protein
MARTEPVWLTSFGSWDFQPPEWLAYEVHSSDCVPGLHQLYDRDLGDLKLESPP